MEWLNNINWSQVIAFSGITTIVTGVIVASAQYFLNRKMELHKLMMNGYLEEYKIEIQKITENLRFENQCKLMNYSLYINKKHESYLKINEAVITIELKFELLKRKYYDEKTKNNLISGNSYAELKHELFWDCLETDFKIIQYQSMVYISEDLFDEVSKYRSKMMTWCGDIENVKLERETREALKNIRETIRKNMPFSEESILFGEQ